MLHRFLFGGGEGRVCGHGGTDTFLGIRVGVKVTQAVSLSASKWRASRSCGVQASQPGEPLVMKPGYCSYLKGKTEKEVADIPADGSDADLAALCTISIDALQKAAGDAFENASL